MNINVIVTGAFFDRIDDLVPVPKFHPHLSREIFPFEFIVEIVGFLNLVEIHEDFCFLAIAIIEFADSLDEFETRVILARDERVFRGIEIGVFESFARVHPPQARVIQLLDR